MLRIVFVYKNTDGVMSNELVIVIEETIQARPFFFRKGLNQTMFSQKIALFFVSNVVDHRKKKTNMSSSPVPDYEDDRLSHRRYDELTLWDIHRPPRKLELKNREIRVQEQMLNPFRCVICLGYLKVCSMIST